MRSPFFNVGRIMNKYELIAIIDSNRSNVDETKTAIQGILERNKAQNVNAEDWGARTLNYEVDYQKSGFFQYVTCELAPESVKEITNELRITGGILQYMIKRVA